MHTRLRSLQRDERREWDSNPRALRPPVFKTGAFNHSAIPPGAENLTPLPDSVNPAASRRQARSSAMLSAAVTPIVGARRTRYN